MEQLMNFIKPELVVLIPTCYFVGMGLKKSKLEDKHIPKVLGATGVALACLYVCGSEGFSMVGAFTAITQGIMCAGTSVYVNQLAKQGKK